MGVRPPQQGDDDEPETVAFGIAALDEHLSRGNVTFPVSDEELLDALGNPAVPYDAKGNEIPLSRALEEAPVDRFENRQELLNVLHPVFENTREHANSSIVGQLRALFPF
jgi:hypothetical protein